MKITVPQNYLEALENLVIFEKDRIFREKTEKLKKQEDEITVEEAWINVRKSLNLSHTKKEFAIDFTEPINEQKKDIMEYDSIEIAKNYNKKHYRIMRHIESIKEFIKDCSLNGDNVENLRFIFEKSSFKNSGGRIYPKYLMNNDAAEMLKLKIFGDDSYKDIIYRVIAPTISEEYEKYALTVDIFNKDEKPDYIILENKIFEVIEVDTGLRTTLILDYKNALKSVIEKLSVEYKDFNYNFNSKKIKKILHDKIIDCIEFIKNEYKYEG